MITCYVQLTFFNFFVLIFFFQYAFNFTAIRSGDLERPNLTTYMREHTTDLTNSNSSPGPSAEQSIIVPCKITYLTSKNIKRNCFLHVSYRPHVAGKQHIFQSEYQNTWPTTRLSFDTHRNV